MTRRILTIGSLAMLFLVVAVYGKATIRQSQSTPPASDAAAAQRAILP